MTYNTILYDVEDGANPIADIHIELEGSLVASRRLGDRLILVTRFQPILPDG